VNEGCVAALKHLSNDLETGVQVETSTDNHVIDLGLIEGGLQIGDHGTAEELDVRTAELLDDVIDNALRSSD
jgi:hypothetical protein